MQDIEKNNENDLVIDYDYKFNIVTDNDIKKVVVFRLYFKTWPITEIRRKQDE